MAPTAVASAATRFVAKGAARVPCGPRGGRAGDGAELWAAGSESPVAGGRTDNGPTCCSRNRPQVALATGRLCRMI